MPPLQVPRRFLRSAASISDPGETERSARFLIAHATEQLGRDGLADVDLLDVGCGTKMTEAFVNDDIPIGSYTGVDVVPDMIDFLRENVDDPRFRYHHVDAHNALYNPDGAPMTEHTDIGVDDRTFDVIWLFSVFTHLAPHDYVTMLRLLRRHIRPDGRLFFTLFVDRLTEGGHGFTDRVHQELRARSGVEDGASLPTPEPQPFIDVIPDPPLQVAMYSEAHAYELLDGTGWEPLELVDPNEFAQHQLICAPI